jgi:MFS family permease
MLKRFGGPWLAFLVVGFGVVSVCSAFLHSFGGLIATRVFLGLTEGGTLVSVPVPVLSVDSFGCWWRIFDRLGLRVRYCCMLARLDDAWGVGSRRRTH